MPHPVEAEEARQAWNEALQATIHEPCRQTEEDLRRQLAETRTALKDVANALIGTTTTLDSVDPNAPSLEVAELVIEKHISTIGPLIEEARKRKEQ